MKQHAFPILTAEEAAAMIQNGQTISFSAFAPAGAAKAVPVALAERAKAEHATGRPFKVGVLTGASTGPTIDGALAQAEAISFRTTLPAGRGAARADQLGEGELLRHAFVELAAERPLRVLWPDRLRSGRSVRHRRRRRRSAHLFGWRNTHLLRRAGKIIIEVNAHHPSGLLRMHYIFEPQDPPTSQQLQINHPSDRRQRTRR